ncbi:MAG: hypothetical protein ACHQUC_08570 [Chlamydiales bacterium]
MGIALRSCRASDFAAPFSGKAVVNLTFLHNLKAIPKNFMNIKFTNGVENGCKWHWKFLVAPSSFSCPPLFDVMFNLITSNCSDIIQSSENILQAINMVIEMKLGKKNH